MDILKIIFVILLLTFTLGESVRFDLGNSIFVKLTDFAVFTLVLTWLTLEIKNRNNKIFGGQLSRSILLFVAIAFVSLVVNIKNLSNAEFLISLSYLARWVLYACLYYVVKSFPSEFKKKILYILFSTGALLVLFGFIQYFFYSSLRNLYYLGWDEHAYRMFSTFLDPNFAGAFFVLYLIFLSGIFLFFLKKQRKSFVVLTSVVFLLTLFASYLTFSRSTLIMLFASFLTFSILTKRVRWTIILVLTSLVFLLYSSKNFYIENINLFRVVSTEARLKSARTAIQIVKDNPILGVGFNAYRYAQIKYGFRHKEGSILSHADAGTDNSFLFVLATTGVIGFAGFMFLWYSILRYTLLQYYNKVEPIPAIIFSSCIGLFVDSLFINSLFYTPLLLWLWVLMGVTENK